MKALIVEDEPMAQARLAKMIAEEFHDIEIIGRTDSVRSSLEFLSRESPDVIFMDVELSDGVCFEIFKQTSVSANVIMTTAYDSYAVRAFEAGSIDYILKPIEMSALRRAVERCRQRAAGSDSARLLAALGSIGAPQRPKYRKRVVVHLGDSIIPIDTQNIAYYISEGKFNCLVTHEGKKYVVDATLDALESELDPEQFFRIGRGCIVSRRSVGSITRHLNGRLRLTLSPDPSPAEILVSRARVDDFLAWLE